MYAGQSINPGHSCYSAGFPTYLDAVSSKGCRTGHAPQTPVDPIGAAPVGR